MTSTHITSADFDRAKNLIPGHLKNCLSKDDSAWMKGFLTQLQGADLLQAQAFAREVQWVEKTQAQMQQTLPHIDVEAGWQHLAAKLQAASAAGTQASQVGQASPLVAAQAGPTSAEPASAMGKIADWLKQFIRKRIQTLLDLWRKPAVVVLGSAMIVGQMGMLAAVVKKLHTAENTSMAIPASGAKGVASDQVVVVQVIFKDKTSVADIRKLLDQSGAQIIGGPSAIGVWEVQIAKDKQVTIIDQISKSKSVESISLP